MSLFQEVEDNYPENLPDFYDVQVLFLFCIDLHLILVQNY